MEIYDDLNIDICRQIANGGELLIVEYIRTKRRTVVMSRTVIMLLYVNFECFESHISGPRTWCRVPVLETVSTHKFFSNFLRAPSFLSFWSNMNFKIWNLTYRICAFNYAWCWDCEISAWDLCTVTSMHQFERHRRITTNDSVLFPNIIAVVGHIRIDTRTVVVSRTVMVLQFESPRTWCSVLDIVSAHRFFTSDWSHLTTLMPLGQGRWPGSWRTGFARCCIAFSAMDLVKAIPVLKNPAAN